MSTNNGNSDKKDEFEGSTGESNGQSAGMESKAKTNSLLLSNNYEPAYSREHQLAAAAVQASQVPQLVTEGQEAVKNGQNRTNPVKPNVPIRSRRSLLQGRKSAVIKSKTSVPQQQEQQEKPDPYSVAALMAPVEEIQNYSSSVARTMAMKRGSLGKGVKRRAPNEIEEVDETSNGENLKITQKLKYGDLSNRDVDVVGSSKEKKEDLCVDANQANSSQEQLSHKLVSNDKPEEVKLMPSAGTAAVHENISPPVESIHKKFKYKKWSAGARAKNLGLVQEPNLVSGAAGGPCTASGAASEPFTASGAAASTTSGSVNESFTAFAPVNGTFTVSTFAPVSGALTASFSVPVSETFTAPEYFFRPYTEPEPVNGAPTEIRPINIPRVTILPSIEAYTVPGPLHETQNPVAFFSGSQIPAGITTTEPYFVAGSVNGLHDPAGSLGGTHFASGFDTTPYIEAGEVDQAKPFNGPSIGTGTLRDLLSAKKPFQNPYGVVVPVSKAPASSTVTSATATAAGSNGRSAIPPENLQRMLGELVLSPYITETQAVGRLKSLGTTQNVQAEIDRFAAIIGCGNAYAANRANEQQQAQLAQQQRQDITATASMSTAARDLIQAKHRDSVIKGGPKK